MIELETVAARGPLRTPYDDVALLAAHRAAGGDLSEVIYLSLGETWHGPPRGLLAHLAAVPAHAHGYVLSPYGLPELQTVLRRWIPTSHRLDPVGLHRDYDVAACHGSTRAAMFDLGRWLRQEQPAGRPVLICPSPGWDYPGVYATPTLGYDVHRYTLKPQDGFQPDPAAVAEVLHRARARTRGPIILAINAQHNPTGANWTPPRVRGMIRAGLDAHAVVLIDDAYYGLTDPDTEPTSALAILLDELAAQPAGRRPPWLAVRSLGKQFHCNGWGIGALTAAPRTLEALGQLATERTYASAIPAQAALARWLAEDASTEFLTQQRAAYAAKRRTATHLLTGRLGYPPDAVVGGCCTAYLLARIPYRYTRPDAEVAATGYRELVLARALVLLGEAHMTSPGRAVNAAGGWIRIHLGATAQDLTQALERIANAGLGWQAPAVSRTTPSSGKDALTP